MSYFSYGRNMFRTHALQFYKVEWYLRMLEEKLLFVRNLFSIISFWENIHMVICVWLSFLINYYCPQCEIWDKHLWLFQEWFKSFSIEYFWNVYIGIVISIVQLPVCLFAENWHGLAETYTLKKNTLSKSLLPFSLRIWPSIHYTNFCVESVNVN